VHEVSFAEGVLGLVEKERRRQGFASARVIFLEIGRLAAVDIDALRFCFAAVSVGSAAEGARLAIDSVEARAWCEACAASVAVAARYDACPHCGHFPLALTDGAQMRVSAIEVD
jgi:hydrogenase nickel incorporation protein HypA/HybF